MPPKNGLLVLISIIYINSHEVSEVMLIPCRQQVVRSSNYD